MKIVNGSPYLLKELTEDTIYLQYYNWDDFSYCTTFYSYYVDYGKNIHCIGNLKVGCENLSEKVPKQESINGYSSYSMNNLIKYEINDSLPEGSFSLGQDSIYYKNIRDILGVKSSEYLEVIKDLANDRRRFNSLYRKNEPSLINSLMRSLYISTIDQFSRILNGQAELTKYEFNIKYKDQCIEVNVDPDEFIPDNIHVLIGRNGVGKSWLLHNIVVGLMSNSNLNYENFKRSKKYIRSEDFSVINEENSFAGIIGISFSVFDDALTFMVDNKKAKEEVEIEKLKKIYKYIGVIEKEGKNNKEAIEGFKKLIVYIDVCMKNVEDNYGFSALKCIKDKLELLENKVDSYDFKSELSDLYRIIELVKSDVKLYMLKKDMKEIEKVLNFIKEEHEEEINVKVKSVKDLCREFLDSLEKIKRIRSLSKLYFETIDNLDNDAMFSDNGFISLLKGYLNNNEETSEVKRNFQLLSSGHMIIILSLTLLTESIQEKTIVVIDEPETHLHPPLLSTYIRTLSYLLLRKNAVAIIATHSPIILQEVPKRCVNKITRVGDEMRFDKINAESFAANVDLLTREVFGLELINTGFYKLITDKLGDDLDDTLNKFNGEIGFLGQSLIQNLLWEKRWSDDKNLHSNEF
ncbi:MAG: AAA family ATPase [Clostridium chrysemydis]|uniref:AAA family ATPase n=1 Tax=Clostridium chrysemydis TaxID=2665504 RepID=UPI003F367B1B